LKRKEGHAQQIIHKHFSSHTIHRKDHDSTDFVAVKFLVSIASEPNRVITIGEHRKATTLFPDAPKEPHGTFPLDI